MLRLRRSARVFLFDPSGDLFLIRFVAELDGEPFIFWVTPGGEVEPGEGTHEAAARELREEVGLTLPLVGPVLEDAGSTYTHLGETVRNSDTYFAAVCEREAPRLAGVTADEIRLMQEARWWTLAELQSTEERVFPAGLAQHAARVWSDLRARGAAVVNKRGEER